MLKSKNKKTKPSPSWLAGLVNDLGRIECLDLDVNLPDGRHYHIVIKNCTPDNVRERISFNKQIEKDIRVQQFQCPLKGKANNAK